MTHPTEPQAMPDPGNPPAPEPAATPDKATPDTADQANPNPGGTADSTEPVPAPDQADTSPGNPALEAAATPDTTPADPAPETAATATEPTPDQADTNPDNANPETAATPDTTDQASTSPNNPALEAAATTTEPTPDQTGTTATPAESGTNPAEPGTAQSEPAESGQAEDAEATKTFSIDTDPPVVDDRDKPPGTTPPWWEWMRKRRKPVLLVTGLLVVALVATLVIVAVVTPGPKDVVQKYLDALQAGDVDTARTIAGEPEDGQYLAFLTEKALADDWTVDAIAERHRDEDDAEVDVTIRAGDLTQQGRFSLVHDDEAGWRLETPYVKVNLAVGDIDAVELGGERLPMHQSTPIAQNGVAELLLFPGVYELYPSLAKRAKFEPSVLIATPQGSQDSVLQATPARTLTDAGEDEVQQAINKHVDECATRSDTEPSGCPFSARESSALRDFDFLDDVTWTVVNYPEVNFATGNDNAIALDLRKPGTVRLTGTAVPDEPEGAARVNIALTCEFGVDGIGVTLLMNGFQVSGGRPDYTVQTSTKCF